MQLNETNSKCKLFIVTDFRVTEQNNKYYLASQHYHIIKRYHDAFGSITLCARVVHKEPDNKLIEATDIINRFVGVSGLFSSLKIGFRKRIRPYIAECDIFVTRFPSIIACSICKLAKKFDKPIFAELMGDVWDGLWNHGVVGKLIAPYMFFKTKHAVKNADYALYVTSEFLQKRYPCKNESVSASNVLISETPFEILSQRLEKVENMQKFEICLMTTAAVNVKYKGQQYVIKAIPKLNKFGIKVKYYVVGGGDQEFLRSLAAKHDVSDQVIFTGRLALDDVFKLLDDVDIYIQPSLQEGLPRSVIEAMSRACPCIGARTAGIPELIEDKYVVKRKSVNDIVNKVVAFCTSSIEEQKATAIRNFEESKKYLEDVLNERRTAYYEKVKNEIKGK